MLAVAENAKIALSAQTIHYAGFDFIEPDFSIPIQRTLFDGAIRADVDAIVASAKQCLQDAGVGQEAIELVILTGGSTEVQAIQAAFRSLFPKAAIADDNKLSSVGLGLAYASDYTFGQRR
jgi:hypothetical chaperone protein